MTARGSSPTGLYVYGVVPTGEADAPSDVGDASVRLVARDGLAAVVSEVALDDFREETLPERLEQPGWLEERVRRHDRVLEGFVRRGTVVPFRFGAIYEGEDAVLGMLREHGGALEAALRRVAGRREWGVKLFVDRSELARGPVDADAPTTAELGAGRAYFAAKGRERAAREEARAAARVIAADVHEQLAAVAEAAADVPARGDAPDLALNGAYLVAREREQSFADAVAALSREHEARGVRLELTGPWPPYSFVGEDGA